MSDADWEIFDALFKTAHRQCRRIEDLETRLCGLERRLSDREAETGSTLRLVSEKQATLEVHVSELRHKAGITEVDELYEEAESSRPVLRVVEPQETAERAS